MKHPYRTQPDSAFWAKSVSSNWDPAALLHNQFILRETDRVASAGSCFAANLIPYLKKSNIHYVQEEPRHPAFLDMPYENFSYDKFSAAYGNIYTVRQFHQLLERSTGDFTPREDRWASGGRFVDPFRPGLKYAAKSHREFDGLTSQHLTCVRRAFEKATVVILTLGLTESWQSKIDGAVFPACPGTVGGNFDPKKHEFHNFSVAEVVSDLHHVYAKLRQLRPDVRLILTVSPVPLVATATPNHVLTASTLSKSILRAACGEVQQSHAEVIYFPAYEIITGPQAPDDFFETDKRSVSSRGVDEVMKTFLAHCEAGTGTAETSSLAADDELRLPDMSKLSMDLSEMECEEAAMGR